MDWSKILIAAMALFIIFIVSMGVKMATSNQALYENDYYEQGEMHTERMEMEKVGETISADYNGHLNALELSFKKAGVITETKLIFLADNGQDFSIRPLGSIAKTNIIIPLERELKPGIWYMEISGESGGQLFFKKQQFVK